MLSLRTKTEMKSAIARITDPQLKTLLATRIDQLTMYDSFDTSELSHFLVVEAGDTLTAITAKLGWSPLDNFVDSARYGHPDFTPSWEWIDNHAGWFEAVFIISDDGFGINSFVQDHPKVDPKLLAMCREYTSADPP